MKRLVCILAVALGPVALGQKAGPQKAGPQKAGPQKAGPQKAVPATAPRADASPTEAGPEAGVNWAGPVLKATGSGAPDLRASSAAQARLGAEMAAKMDAFRNLLAQARGIQVSAGRTLGDVMQRDEVRGRVEGVIRGYKVVAKRSFSDQGVELDVEVPLGALADAVAAPAGASTAVAEARREKTSHSGIIVDATGLKVTPALAPRLLDESGAPVYSAEQVAPEARKVQGVASYHASVDEAKKSQRVGRKPLVVKALRADGSDLVLPAVAIAQLKASNPRYLAEGRVAIVSR